MPHLLRWSHLILTIQPGHWGISLPWQPVFLCSTRCQWTSASSTWPAVCCTLAPSTQRRELTRSYLQKGTASGRCQAQPVGNQESVGLSSRWFLVLWFPGGQSCWTLIGSWIIVPWRTALFFFSILSHLLPNYSVLSFISFNIVFVSSSFFVLININS